MGRTFVLWCAATALLASPPRPASAQSSVRQINVQTFEPSTSHLGIVTLDSADTLGNLNWYAGLGFAYALDPLRAVQGGTTVFHYVRNHVMLDVVGAIGIWKYFEIGLHLPAAVYQDGSGPDPLGGVSSSLRSAALGDLRVVPKARLWLRQGKGLGLAIIPQFTVPSGAEGGHAGERFLTFEPKVVLDYQFAQGTLVTLNVGFRLRRAVEVGSLRVGHELFYGVGAEVPVFRRRLAVLAEVIGAVGIKDAARDPDGGIDEEELPLEALAGVRYRFPFGLLVTAGAGVGLTNGWGAPTVRVFAGVGYTWGDAARPVPYPGDPDGDGIVGIADRCPNEPEDKDGFQDEDGCPDPDNDGDGICDDNPTIQRDLANFRDRCTGRDRCPTQKEVINGVKDEDGCPDEGKPTVYLEKNQIVMVENIYFRTGSSHIQGRSHRILGALASLLRSRQEIRRVEVEGHTDERGSGAANLRLSQRRAQAVRRFLVGRGIRAARLVARGYGDTKPVARGCNDLPTTAEKETCWGKNRRVVFRILD